MKRLSEVLSLDCVKVPLSGINREEVIRELIEILATKSVFDNKEEIYKSILERERIMTTGVGNNIAIPHCKNDSCKDFRLALGVTDEDIEFQSVDQKPVNIIFLLVGPNTSAGTHIKLLSRITRLLSQNDVREKLKSLKSAEEVHNLMLEEENNYFS